MNLNRSAAWLSLSAAVYVSGFCLIQAQDKPDYLVDHSDCTLFGANREKFVHTQFRLGYDDPFGRGFEYVPFANSQDLYGPINELWT